MVESSFLYQVTNTLVKIQFMSHYDLCLIIFRLTEKARREREKERREQYKQVRAHVKKDDGRMQAYGWSLPAKFTMPQPKESTSKSQVPVPVPVYCRPLMEKEPGMKVGTHFLSPCTRGFQLLHSPWSVPSLFDSSGVQLVLT